MAKTVTVTIDEDANFAVDLNGFNGKGCDAVIKLFDGIGTVTKETTKPEYKTVNANVIRK